MKNPYKTLERALGYSFRKRKRLKHALTHRSFRYEQDGVEDDNQRLEFLGDAALGFVTAAYLYSQYPHMQEGELTMLRSRATSGNPLAEFARQCDLGSFLMLGRGEGQSGGHERRSNLTDAMEAVIGAAYQDGGIKAVQRIFARVIVPYIEELRPSYADDNPKGHLQEIVQGRWKVSPHYKVISEDGPSHRKLYTIEVHLNNRVFGSGQGTNKRVAQMEAARKALMEIEHLDELPETPDREGGVD